MSTNIKVDRARLADYFREHADVLAAQADLRVDVDEDSSNAAGVVFYTSTVRISLEEIPLEAVEAKS